MLYNPVFTFDELLKRGNPRAIDKARETLSRWNADYDWWEGVCDGWKDKLATIGIENVDITFSGFWSQGDGASFTADIDVHKLACVMSNRGDDPRIAEKINGIPHNPRYRHLLRLADSGLVSLRFYRSSHHYSHENTCGTEAELQDNKGEFDADSWTWIPQRKRINALWGSFVADVESLRRDICRAIYRDLENEYDYLRSDESLRESADANGCEFDENGNII